MLMLRLRLLRRLHAFKRFKMQLMLLRLKLLVCKRLRMLRLRLLRKLLAYKL